MSEKKLIKRFLELQKKLDDIKDIYQEIDDITEKLASGKRSSWPQKSSIVLLVDQFASKNVIFRNTSFKRYVLKVEPSR